MVAAWPGRAHWIVETIGVKYNLRADLLTAGGCCGVIHCHVLSYLAEWISIHMSYDKDVSSLGGWLLTQVFPLDSTKTIPSYCESRDE